MRTLVAGVDCSTQSTKVVVLDADTGETVGSGRAEHSVEGSEGVRETHPDVWWQALLVALRQLLSVRLGLCQNRLVKASLDDVRLLQGEARFIEKLLSDLSGERAPPE